MGSEGLYKIPVGRDVRVEQGRCKQADVWKRERNKCKPGSISSRLVWFEGYTTREREKKKEWSVIRL